MDLVYSMCTVPPGTGQPANPLLIIKECVTIFSTSIFIHDPNLSGPLINRLEYFRIRFQICLKNSVHDTVESKF